MAAGFKESTSIARIFQCLLAFSAGYILTGISPGTLKWKKEVASSNIKDDMEVVKRLQGSHYETLYPRSLLGVPLRTTPDVTEAQRLYNRVRVLVFMFVRDSELYTRAIHTRRTWGSRPNVMLYMTNKTNPSFPSVKLEIKESRRALMGKLKAALYYVHDHYFDEADWFVKVDPDSYLIMENMRYFLSDKNHSKPLFYGHWFSPWSNKQGYVSGAAMLMSKEAVRRFVLYEKKVRCADRGADDVGLGVCMHKVNVTLGDSRDALGRSRFHCFSPSRQLLGPLPPWIHMKSKYNKYQGIDTVSDLAIGFHYIRPQELYYLHYYVYGANTFGRRKRHYRNLNKPPDPSDTAIKKDYGK